MNSDRDIWYNELYRLFSEDTLLNVYQAQKLGKAMLAIQNDEDATPALNELYYSIRQFEDLAEELDEYIHAYIKHQEEVNNDAENDKDHGGDTPEDRYHY